ncbi:fimbrial protein [Rahnella inusitata]|uniref:fimbrial protein n=1 Tax=Rahnella inusitata TaxID=58169 RepID=UPI0039B04339
MNKIFIILALFLLSGFPSAYASKCSFDSGYSANSTTIVLPSTVRIRGDLPTSTLLWSSGWINGGETHVTCTSTGFTMSDSVTTEVGYANAIKLSSAGYSIYDTGIPGIGIRVYYSNSHTLGGNMQYLDWPRKSTVDNFNNYMNYIPASEYKVEFWSTGAYKSGRTSFPSPIANLYYGSLLTNQATFSNTTFIATIVGCNVASSVNVDLGSISSTVFTGVGSASAWKDFTIPLNCYSGTKISTTIDATKDSSGATSVIKPTSGTGTATGFGVQLYYSGGESVSFGTKKLLVTSSSTTASINLATRIYQTQKAITEGKVSAVAYLTMTYE